MSPILIPYDVFHNPLLSPADKFLFPYLGQTDSLCGVHEVSFRNLAELTGLHKNTLPRSLDRYEAAGYVEVIGRTKGRNGGIAYRVNLKCSKAGKNRKAMYYVKSEKRPSDLNQQQIFKLKREMLLDRYAGCHELIKFLFLR